MARRCICRGLAATVLQDPRMRLLPLAARALWLLLADALASMPEPGVARIGGKPMGTQEIAMLVSVRGTDDETQLETQIETLVQTGLLNRAPDGALALPEPPAAADRSRVARQNGAAGGRPRRGETAEKARQRRQQGALMLPVRGGLSETQETQREPGAENPPRAGGLACYAKKEAKPAVREETLALADKVADLAGLDCAKSMHDARPVLAWLAAGIAPDLICETVARIAARPGYTPPRSLAYFGKAVMEAADESAPIRPAQTSSDPAHTAEVSAYLAAVERWKASDRLDPPPQMPSAARREAA